MQKQFVCKLNQLKQRQTYGYTHTVAESTQQFFLVLHRGEVFSYRNQCPHTGVSLNYLPHQFFNSRRTFIQCAMHGALFEIDSGLCIHGPCIRQHLQAIDNDIINQSVFLLI